MYADALAYYDVNDNLKELAGALARKARAGRARILVGVDGSPASLGAVEHARELLHGGAGDVRLANVQPAPAARDAREAGERALLPAMALLDAAQVPYRAEVVFGEPAEALLRHAVLTRSTLIALGKSNRHAVLELLGGSMARRVMARARLPVTLVERTLRATTFPPRGAAGEARAA